ncbi:MAG: TIGR00303 family protein [Treponema sp.]|nr:TIGR00303 family protein [Treponema sp.]
MFLLCIGGTELSKVPGLSAAGANPELVPFTAPADADLIRFGRPKVVDGVPLDPEGHPSPALITRAAVLEADIPICVVRAGSYIPPTPPYIELGAGFGKDPRLEPAVPDGVEVFERAREFARAFGRHHQSIMIAESIPGGTTTALLILRALGYREMVSSAGPQNPTALKEAVWNQASERIGIRPGDLAQDPLRALTELGDPMQGAVAGLVMGLPPETEVILAGGTQMLAVAALVRALGAVRKPLVATTKYVQGDESSGFNALARILDLETWIAPLDFSKVPYQGLSDYERGYVKEGVGAGGSVLYAQRAGVGVERIIAKTTELYAEMIKPRAEVVK